MSATKEMDSFMNNEHILAKTQNFIRLTRLTKIFQSEIVSFGKVILSSLRLVPKSQMTRKCPEHRNTQTESKTVFSPSPKGRKLFET